VVAQKVMSGCGWTFGRTLPERGDEFRDSRRHASWDSPPVEA